MIYDNIALCNGAIFQHAYDILNQRMQQGILRLKEGNNGRDGKARLDAALCVSVIVNASFASELFLKSMLPNNKRGHRLNDLFALLDSRIQNNIRSYTVEEINKCNHGYNDVEFQKDLNDNSNKFTEWRYFHEEGDQKANVLFLSCFMRATFKAANEEKSTISVVSEE